MDRDIMLSWRNTEPVRKNMYTDHVISPPEHNEWFERALADPNAVYLIFEYINRPVGLVSFTNISRVHSRCSWAFYLGDAEVPRGTGRAMELFALAYAFEELKVRKLCCEVFAFNAKVVRLHEEFGFSHEGRLFGHFLKNGGYEDVVVLAKFRAGWDAEKPQLFAKCFDSGNSQ